jgi:hypothetical protein
MSTDPLLELLRRKARFTHQELADLLSQDAESVARAWPPGKRTAPSSATTP